MQRKKRLSSEEKRQLVFNALFDARGPLSTYKLHKLTGLGTDLLNYHLRVMVESGLVIPLEDGKYTLQALYYEQEALRSLETSMELVVSILSSHIVWDYVNLEKQDEFSVVSSNLELFLRALKQGR